MRYKIAPLKGKYYGTMITKEGSAYECLSVWGVAKKGKPSHRELDLWEGEGDHSEIMCDGHYEDAGDLEAAKVIVEALNKHFSDEEVKGK